MKTFKQFLTEVKPYGKIVSLPGKPVASGSSNNFIRRFNVDVSTGHQEGEESSEPSTTSFMVNVSYSNHLKDYRFQYKGDYLHYTKRDSGTVEHFNESVKTAATRILSMFIKNGVDAFDRENVESVLKHYELSPVFNIYRQREVSLNNRNKKKLLSEIKKAADYYKPLTKKSPNISSIFQFLSDNELVNIISMPIFGGRTDRTKGKYQQTSSDFDKSKIEPRRFFKRYKGGNLTYEQVLMELEGLILDRKEEIAGIFYKNRHDVEVDDEGVKTPNSGQIRMLQDENIMLDNLMDLLSMRPLDTFVISVTEFDPESHRLKFRIFTALEFGIRWKGAVDHYHQENSNPPILLS